MYCVETKNLSYRFSESQPVLNGLNLQVPEQAIYGFLGKNGAGKTTTLKLILGLLKKQSDEVLVFNKPFAENRLEILKRTGSLIETPSIYGHLNAFENLQLLQKIYRCKRERIAEVLALTDLADTGNKKAGKFSLGMKQRLSIAIALLNSPSLLILDEPTNGLDPNGIIEMRAFLKKLNTEHNITIIISSHLLTEVEKLVTHVGIINNGTLKFQGTLNELMEKQKLSTVHILDSGDNAKAMLFLKTQAVGAYINNEKIILPDLSKETLALLLAKMSEQHIQVVEITTFKKDLEAIFIDLIKT